MTTKDISHLRPATRAWVRQVCKEYELESHHEKLLLTVANSWDRILEAREKLAAEGLDYTDSRGVRRPHPAVKLEHDATIRMMRGLRELDLDVSPPSESRPP